MSRRCVNPASRWPTSRWRTSSAQHAIVLAGGAPALAPGQTALQAPDPGDPLLWDLLAARQDLVLVTGDKLLLQDPAMNGRVITLAAFWA